ncbi:MAG TPA: hypothetical protein PKA37_11500 [Planctomycetota bacterium]|jgi:hypothetical protein|nr:hypothetical protein [Planctomycetota bacterium]
MPPANRHRHPPYRRDGETWLIEIQLDEVRQLFHTLDPAPFHRRDLDPAAAQYIEEAVREIGATRPLRIVVHLPASEADTDDARTLHEAVAHYFSYRADESRTELKRLLLRGSASLAIGALFLAFCLSVRDSLIAASIRSDVITEGLLIIGWVGLWRPVEIFLYDWWPIWRQRRRLDALARAEVQISIVVD